MAENKSMVYTIPLRREFQKASFKRKTNKAMRALKEYLLKHTKADRVVIGEELNEQVWGRGITNPPAKVRVEVTKETVEKDNTKIVEAFANLVGVGRTVIEQKKKGIIQKESKTMKDRIEDAVGTLKGDKEETTETKKVEEVKETPKKDSKDETKVEEATSEKKVEAKTETKKEEKAEATKEVTDKKE